LPFGLRVCTPRAQETSRFSPSVATSDGYQPVGIYPRSDGGRADDRDGVHIAQRDEKPRFVRRQRQPERGTARQAPRGRRAEQDRPRDLIRRSIDLGHGVARRVRHPQAGSVLAQEKGRWVGAGLQAARDAWRGGLVTSTTETVPSLRWKHRACCRDARQRTGSRCRKGRDLLPGGRIENVQEAAHPGVRQTGVVHGEQVAPVLGTASPAGFNGGIAVVDADSPGAGFGWDVRDIGSCVRYPSACHPPSEKEHRSRLPRLSTRKREWYRSVPYQTRRHNIGRRYAGRPAGRTGLGQEADFAGHLAGANLDGGQVASRPNHGRQSELAVRRSREAETGTSRRPRAPPQSA
jgi:hypothetical protein